MHNFFYAVAGGAVPAVESTKQQPNKFSVKTTQRKYRNALCLDGFPTRQGSGLGRATSQDVSGRFDMITVKAHGDNVGTAFRNTDIFRSLANLEAAFHFTVPANATAPAIFAEAPPFTVLANAAAPAIFAEAPHFTVLANAAAPAIFAEAPHFTVLANAAAPAIFARAPPLAVLARARHLKLAWFTMPAGLH
jgi:hypothetical protein